MQTSPQFQLSRHGTTLTMVVFLALTATAGQGWSADPIPVIFDTDIQGDVDDVGSVAMLHTLADLGEIEILAMGVSAKNPWSPLCLDSLNTFYGRPDVPLGVVKGPAFDKASKYAQQVAEEYPRRLQSGDDAEDAAIIYRRALAKAQDGSVVLVSVGQLTNMRNLLQTQPDEHSRLDGQELVRRKVRVWVCMGGRLPEGPEANLIHDGPAAAYAIEHWPTPIVFSTFRLGHAIHTGGRFREKPKSHPARRAYELYNGLKSKASYDQTAVLYAGRGLDGGLDHVWDLHETGYMHVAEDGRTEWRASPDKDHAYLVEKMPPAQVAPLIEELMLAAPVVQK